MIELRETLSHLVQSLHPFYQFRILWSRGERDSHVSSIKPTQSGPKISALLLSSFLSLSLLLVPLLFLAQYYSLLFFFFPSLHKPPW